MNLFYSGKTKRKRCGMESKLICLSVCLLFSLICIFNLIIFSMSFKKINVFILFAINQCKNERKYNLDKFSVTTIHQLVGLALNSFVKTLNKGLTFWRHNYLFRTDNRTSIEKYNVPFNVKSIRFVGFTRTLIN